MRFSMKMFFALISVAVVCTLLHTGDCDARSGVVLSDDYPYASIFLGMSRRGAQDYASRHEQFPDSLDQLVSQGYTAYMFPAAFSPAIAVENEKWLVDSGGRAEYTLGRVSEPGLYGAHLPNGELYVLREEYVLPGGDPDEERVLQQVKWYLFRGAEWLDNGSSWSTVEAAQRYDRVVTHLVNASL